MKWISVKDKLPQELIGPDEGHYFLVREHWYGLDINQKEIEGISVDICQYNAFPAPRFTRYTNDGYTEDVNVTHWLPLPSPDLDMNFIELTDGEVEYIKRDLDQCMSEYHVHPEEESAYRKLGGQIN